MSTLVVVWGFANGLALLGLAWHLVMIKADLRALQLEVDDLRVRRRVDPSPASLYKDQYKDWKP